MDPTKSNLMIKLGKQKPDVQLLTIKCIFVRSREEQSELDRLDTYFSVTTLCNSPQIIISAQIIYECIFTNIVYTYFPKNAQYKKCGLFHSPSHSQNQSSYFFLISRVRTLSPYSSLSKCTIKSDGREHQFRKSCFIGEVMTRLSLLICIIFLFCLREASAGWKDIFNPKPIYGISGQCQNDTNTWMKSLQIFATVSTECIVMNKCTVKELKILEENLYAVQRKFLLFNS